MKRFWAGIAILSASWLPGMAWYHRIDWGVWLRELLTRPFTAEEAYLIQADWLLWGVMVTVGTLLLVGTPPSLPGRRLSWIAALLFVPAALVLDWPYRIIPLLGVVGLALVLLPAPGAWVRRVGGGLLTAGIVLTAQAVALYAYEALSARSHELPWPLTSVLGLVASLAGQDSAVSGNMLGLHSMREMHRLGATWELLFDPVSLCFLVGGIALLIMRPWPASAGGSVDVRRTARRVVLLAILLLAWLPIRAGLLIAIYLHRVMMTDYDSMLLAMNGFWSTPLHLALLAGPVLMAWKFLKAPPEPAALPSATPGGGSFDWRPAAAAGLALVAAMAFTAAATWEPIGQRQPGRVLVDERHSNWERTDKAMDTEWYGHLSGYNYACAYDYLSRFYSISRLTEPISADSLRSCDVLVLKCPTEPFTPDEIDAIHRFVADGGGLILIGEHTNVFGIGEHLNAVAGEFGFAYRYDCLFGIDSVFEQRYSRPLIPHPIVQYLPPLDFEVSCSLAVGNSRGKAAIRAVNLKSGPADYHASNFYPAAVDRPDMRYGVWVQLWATRYGSGRVVAFTDSTQFSNFSQFEPGKPELLVGMVEWANHRDSIGNPSLWLALVGLALAAACVGLARGRPALWVILVAAGILGHAAAAMTIQASNRAAMPPPPAIKPYTLVTVDRTASDVLLPKGGFIGGKDEGFGIFERWILRLGYFTQRATGPDMTRGDLALVINPSKEVPESYREALASYVEQGGRLLVLDSYRNSRSTANSILWPLGIEVRHDTPLAGQLSPSPGLPAVPVKEACEIRGGVPLATIQGRPVMVCKQVGKGTVTVVGFSSRFSDANMGVTGDIEPDAAMRMVYDLEYALLRAIVDDHLPVTAPPPPGLPAAYSSY